MEVIANQTFAIDELNNVSIDIYKMKYKEIAPQKEIEHQRANLCLIGVT